MSLNDYSPEDIETLESALRRLREAVTAARGDMHEEPAVEAGE
ncbi:hypothetical protein [Methylobacter luteus]|nr:hypothetical protein [Methylobacter luteus]